MPNWSVNRSTISMKHSSEEDVGFRPAASQEENGSFTSHKVPTPSHQYEYLQWKTSWKTDPGPEPPLMRLHVCLLLFNYVVCFVDFFWKASYSYKKHTVSVFDFTLIDFQLWFADCRQQQHRELLHYHKQFSRWQEQPLWRHRAAATTCTCPGYHPAARCTVPGAGR